MESDPVISNYYVIFDASGSMGGSVTQSQTKMEAAKSALASFASNLPAEANLGLLTFDPVRELIPLSRGNRSAFMNAVAKVFPRGRTPLRESIFRGYQVLTEQAQRQSGYGRYILVIVTDGESSDGDPAPLAREIVGGSLIEIQTIGFGVANHSLNVNGVTGYVTANSPQSLIDALNSVIASETESFVDPSSFSQ